MYLKLGVLGLGALLAAEARASTGVVGASVEQGVPEPGALEQRAREPEALKRYVVGSAESRVLEPSRLGAGALFVVALGDASKFQDNGPSRDDSASLRSLQVELVALQEERREQSPRSSVPTMIIGGVVAVLGLSTAVVGRLAQAGHDDADRRRAMGEPANGPLINRGAADKMVTGGFISAAVGGALLLTGTTFLLVGQPKRNALNRAIRAKKREIRNAATSRIRFDVGLRGASLAFAF